ncbi:hypothetical protein CASFOL_017474 [Castilleja foliolosa]|uniref:Single-stranded DNA binding protein Ssb-like OB fold domain-containing protein n=1 Tax=Castilleja foliolosa TaxID=1961234 RepID=A0ABD3DC43_9LAMI
MATKSPPASTQQQNGDASAKNSGLRNPMFVSERVSANTVLDKKPPNSTFRGPQTQNTKIASFRIGDETGTILFTSRNEQGGYLKG